MTQMQLDELKAIKQALGGTINDVILGLFCLLYKLIVSTKLAVWVVLMIV